MQASFYKYQGAGNDFIIIDNRDNSFPQKSELIQKCCDRRFGIGGDGLILLESHSSLDFQMKYFNADGLEGSMCGNGGRCIAAFANDIGIQRENYRFQAIDGTHYASILSSFEGNAVVRLSMNKVKGLEEKNNAFIINTGSPHYIVFKETTEMLDVVQEGREIRFSKEYQDEGINVDFVAASGNSLRVRTYERGVENETLSCGTGILASAMAWAYKCNLNNMEYHISCPGGKLKAGFMRDNDSFKGVWIEGPAVKVFQGNISL